MKLKILILLMSSNLFNSYAHDSKEAFFTIEKKEGVIHFNAEFPWSIRNALLTFKPELENLDDEIEFDNAFYEYLNSSVILKDENQKILKLTSVKEVLSHGHSHQTNYTLIFEEGNLTEVTNTLMFNINKNQNNYHILTSEKGEIKFVTNQENPKFLLNSTTEKGFNYYWLFLPVILLAGFLVYNKSSPKRTS